MTVVEATQPAVRGPEVYPLSVKECWLVLGPEQQIEVCRHPTGEPFAESAVHGSGGTLTSTAVPGFTVGIGKLFAE